MAPATRSIVLLHAVPAKIFPKFRSLPFELRLLIYWYIDRLTNDCCVHVQLRTKSEPATKRNSSLAKCLTFRALTPVPLILHLNQESRKEYLKKYIPCFKQTDGRRRIFVNFSRNVLFIRCSEKDFQRNQLQSILNDLDADVAPNNSTDEYLPLLSHQLQIELLAHTWQSPKTSSDGANRSTRKVYEFLIQKKSFPVWVRREDYVVTPHLLARLKNAPKGSSLCHYLENSIQASSSREIPGTYEMRPKFKTYSSRKDVGRWDMGWEDIARWI